MAGITLASVRKISKPISSQNSTSAESSIYICKKSIISCSGTCAIWPSNLCGLIWSLTTYYRFSGMLCHCYNNSFFPLWNNLQGIKHSHILLLNHLAPTGIFRKLFGGLSVLLFIRAWQLKSTRTSLGNKQILICLRIWDTASKSMEIYLALTAFPYCFGIIIPHLTV